MRGESNNRLSWFDRGDAVCYQCGWLSLEEWELYNSTEPGGERSVMWDSLQFYLFS